MIMMKPYIFKAIFGVIFSVILMAGAVSAVTVTVSPDHVNPGDTITVTYSDIPDGADIVLQVEGNLDVPSGASGFVFSTQNITMPFALSPGSFTVTNMNTVANKVTLTNFTEGGMQQAIYTGQSVNGMFTKVVTFSNIESGMWTARDEGTIPTGVTSVAASIMIAGTKTGPDSSNVTFQLGDTDSGTIQVSITVNDTIVLSQEITVTGNQLPEQTGPVFNSLGFLVTPGKASAFKATANPFSVQPGTGGNVMLPGGMLSFFSPTSWGPIRWDNRWAAAFSV